jgi:hypothetical protein
MDDEPEVSRTAFAPPPNRRRRAATPPRIPTQEATEPPLTNQSEWGYQQEIKVPFSQPVGSGAEGSPHAPLTVTSTKDEAAPKANFADISEGMASVFTGLVLLMFTGVGILRKLQRRDMPLRRPTEDEAAAVSEPLARITARHAPVEFASGIAADFLDMAQAVGAADDYIKNSAPTQRNLNSVPTEGTVQS